MIDKDEYPQHRRARAALREHPGPPVALARTQDDGDRLLDHRLERGRACSAGMALLVALAGQARRGRRPDATRPNLVMGANVQVCWEKFCRYWEVEPRHGADGAAAGCT